MFLFLSIVLLLAGVACSEREAVPTRDELLPGGIRAGGSYRINMLRGNPAALDPVRINSKLADDVALQIYDRLISLDSNLNIVPELARSWSISDDGLVYTFHLRRDVTFHDNPCFPGGKGRRMIADDLRYSFERCCDPLQRSVQYWAFNGKVRGANAYYDSRLAGDGLVTSVAGLRAPDDSTFVIELREAYAPFLYYMINSLGCVVPREAVEHYGEDFFQHPVGTGPFVFREWQPDQFIRLERNSQYWQHDAHGNQLPYLDEIIISFRADDKVQFAEFTAGRLEESFSIPSEFFEVVVDGERRSLTPEYQKYRLQARPALLSWFCDFLCSEAPFDNADVRRAFSYAVDREKIVQFVLRGAPYAPAWNGITPPVMPGYAIDSIEGYRFNPTLAREHLRRAGYPDGVGFPPVTLTIYEEPHLVQVAEALQEMLQQTLNIEIRLRKLQFARLLHEAELGKLKFWGTRWYGDYPDAENYLNLFNGSLVPDDATQPSYPNSARYNNPEFNRIFTEAVGTVDPQRRNELYRAAEQLAMRDAPVLMLFYEMHYRLLQPYVRGNPLDPMNRIILRPVWLAAQ